jgi:preprotein translocase subunit SecA
LRKKTKSLTDEQLQSKFDYYRNKINAEPKKKREKTLDKYLVPVFALVREVIFRKKGLLLFPTQILGGIALHYGNIAQMNTGEGKTLTAILPICLNALLGRTVFIVTVNEYLVQRDQELAKPILDFFQISSGFNLTSLSTKEKKDLYSDCTIIYTSGSELGFDYLRNNLATNIEDKRKQDYYFVIADEIDSLFIDECTNPLIISQRAQGDDVITQPEYQLATRLANSLIEKEDYKVEQKEKDI